MVNRMHPIQRRLTWALTPLVLIASLNGISLGERPSAAQLFVASNCLDCHAGESAEAGLDLEALPTDLSDAQAYETWVKIHDRVADGEMPPRDYATLGKRETDPFLSETRQWLSAARRATRAEQGRVGPRRLTNLQLERTLHALLGIDIPLAAQMPEEPKSGEYTTLAEKQSLSHYQLAEHLKVVDLALDEAFRRALTPDDEWTKELSAKDISRTRTRTREPEFIDGESVVWSGRLSFYGRMPALTADEAGWYRFTFPARSLKYPGEDGVWCSVRSGKCVSSAAQLAWVGSFEAMSEPREFSFEAWLPQGHMLEIRPGDQTLKQARFRIGQAENGEGGAQDVPGLAIGGMRLERIHRGADDQQIRKLLFGDLHVQPHRRLEKAVVQVSDPQSTGRALLQRFADSAFRRPAEAEQMQRFYEIFQASLAVDGDFVSALRAGYRAILCSARFMYFYEPPGTLDDFAIASRLSYLLWNSMPDAELFRLASAGQLRNPEAIEAQLERMLQTSDGERFVVDFASQWLELSEIGFTEPDSKLHPDFDMIVQYAMLDETHAFLQHLLEHDLSASELIDSRVTFLNSRLAKFYGIENVRGDAMQLVQLEADSPRGGLLSQGAILKVTANGTNTSPVIRGVWVSERLLGCPIPPPPESVPAIEPDIRGAKTIREQLDMHRNSQQCASCHTKIDPPGFALENFDAAGAWRDHYPKLSGGNVKQAAKVDAAYVLADGTPFANFQEFRALQSSDPEPLARNFASHLLTYGTGAKLDFVDRQELDRIVSSASQHGFGLRSILKSVVTSSTFLTN